MRRTVRWTRRALGRLDDIAGFIAQDNPARATTFVQELRDKVNLLSAHQLGQPGPVEGTWQLVIHKNYLAVYRIQGDQVDVLTILHAAQRR